MDSSSSSQELFIDTEADQSVEESLEGGKTSVGSSADQQDQCTDAGEGKDKPVAAKAQDVHETKVDSDARGSDPVKPEPELLILDISSSPDKSQAEQKPTAAGDVISLPSTTEKISLKELEDDEKQSEGTVDSVDLLVEEDCWREEMKSNKAGGAVSTTATEDNPSADTSDSDNQSRPDMTISKNTFVRLNKIMEKCSTVTRVVMKDGAEESLEKQADEGDEKKKQDATAADDSTDVIVLSDSLDVSAELHTDAASTTQTQKESHTQVSPSSTTDDTGKDSDANNKQIKTDDATDKTNKKSQDDSSESETQLEARLLGESYENLATDESYNSDLLLDDSQALVIDVDEGEGVEDTKAAHGGQVISTVTNEKGKMEKKAKEVVEASTVATSSAMKSPGEAKTENNEEKKETKSSVSIKPTLIDIIDENDDKQKTDTKTQKKDVCGAGVSKADVIDDDDDNWIDDSQQLVIDTQIPDSPPQIGGNIDSGEKREEKHEKEAYDEKGIEEKNVNADIGIAIIEELIESEPADVKCVIATGEDVKALVKDVIAPGKDVMAPGKDVNTSGKDVNAPGKDVIAPGKDVNAPGKDVNAPGKVVSATVKDSSPACKDVNTTGKHTNAIGKDFSATGKDVNTTGTDVKITLKNLNTTGKDAGRTSKDVIANSIDVKATGIDVTHSDKSAAASQTSLAFQNLGKSHTETMLSLIDPIMHKIEPHKRQITASSLGDDREGRSDSYRWWKSVFNSDAAIFQCPVPFQCKIQNVKFNYGSLIIHFMDKHNLYFTTGNPGCIEKTPAVKWTDKWEFSCAVCPMSMPYSVMLIEHFRHHFAPRPYKCTATEECKSLIFNDRELFSHMKSHNLHYPPRINIVYNSSFHTFLWKHRYVCTDCPGAFYQLPKYLPHLVMHADFDTGQKNRDVSKKGLKFNETSKVYECEECLFGTRYGDVFYQHVMSHMTSKHLYKCTPCSITFPSLISFRSHYVRHHGAFSIENCKMEILLDTEAGSKAEIALRVGSLDIASFASGTSRIKKDEVGKTSKIKEMKDEEKTDSKEQKDVKDVSDTLTATYMADDGNIAAAASKTERSGSTDVAGATRLKRSGSTDVAGATRLQRSGSTDVAGATRLQRSGSTDAAGATRLQRSGSTDVAGATRLQRSGSTDVAGATRLQRSGSTDVAGATRLQRSGSTDVADATRLQRSGSTDVAGATRLQRSGSTDMTGATRAQSPDMDIITYLECKQHNMLTTDYVKYILHLRHEHRNFCEVNSEASRSGANTIAFKDGNYMCTGCSLKTPVREIFQEHMRCHALSNPYQCLGCGKEYRDVYSPHSPCWDAGEEEVRISVRPSPTMDSVMQKLGPNAPATGRNNTVISHTSGVSQIRTHGGQGLSALVEKLSARAMVGQESGSRTDRAADASALSQSQVINLDDDDDLVIVEPSTSKEEGEIGIINKHSDPPHDKHLINQPSPLALTTTNDGEKEITKPNYNNKQDPSIENVPVTSSGGVLNNNSSSVSSNISSAAAGASHNRKQKSPRSILTTAAISKTSGIDLTSVKTMEISVNLKKGNVNINLPVESTTEISKGSSTTNSMSGNRASTGVEISDAKNSNMESLPPATQTAEISEMSAMEDETERAVMSLSFEFDNTPEKDSVEEMEEPRSPTPPPGSPLIIPGFDPPPATRSTAGDGPVASSTPARRDTAAPASPDVLPIAKTRQPPAPASSPILKISDRITTDGKMVILASPSVGDDPVQCTYFTKEGTLLDPLSSGTWNWKKMPSYHCGDGYFHCGKCKFKLKTTEQEGFRFHLYIDLHSSKPCGKCRQMGFPSERELNCSLVDDIMEILLEQKMLDQMLYMGTTLPQTGTSIVSAPVTQVTTTTTTIPQLLALTPSVSNLTSLLPKLTSTSPMFPKYTTVKQMIAAKSAARGSDSPPVVDPEKQAAAASPREYRSILPKPSSTITAAVTMEAASTANVYESSSEAPVPRNLPQQPQKSASSKEYRQSVAVESTREAVVRQVQVPVPQLTTQEQAPVTWQGVNAQQHQQGTQLLCGLKDGQLIPLGSVLSNGTVQSTNTNVVIQPPPPPPLIHQPNQQFTNITGALQESTGASVIPQESNPQPDQQQPTSITSASNIGLSQFPSGITPMLTTASGNNPSTSSTDGSNGIKPPPPYRSNSSQLLSEAIESTVKFREQQSAVDTVEKDGTPITQLNAGHQSESIIDNSSTKKNETVFTSCEQSTSQTSDSVSKNKPKTPDKEADVNHSSDQQELEMEIDTDGNVNIGQLKGSLGNNENKIVKDVGEKKRKEENKEFGSFFQVNVEDLEQIPSSFDADMGSNNQGGNSSDVSGGKHLENDPGLGVSTNVKTVAGDKDDGNKENDKEGDKSDVDADLVEMAFDLQKRLEDASEEEKTTTLPPASQKTTRPKEVTRTQVCLKCDIQTEANRLSYFCLTCGYSTPSGKKFKQHLGKHVHNKSTQCDHGGEPDKCPVINALIQFLTKKIKTKNLVPMEKVIQEKTFAYTEESEEESQGDSSGDDAQHTKDKKLKRAASLPDDTRSSEDDNKSEDSEDEGEDEVMSGREQEFFKDVEEAEKAEQEGNIEQYLENREEEKQQQHRQQADDAIFAKMPPPEPIYKCAVGACRFSHDGRDEFIQHIFSRHAVTSERLKCRCCRNQSYYSTEDLSLHLQRRDRELHKFCCAYCGYTAPTIELYRSHLESEHSDKKVQYCSYCETDFPNIEALIAHLNMNVKKVFKCPYCERLAPVRKNLLLHMPRGHPGYNRRTVESTVVYCENKLNPGHSVLAGKRVSPKKAGTMVHGEAGGEEQGSNGQVVTMPPPSNNPGLTSQDQQQQGGGSNSKQHTTTTDNSTTNTTTNNTSASNMDCQHCNFVAFSKAQLEHHEMWHEDSTVSQKAFHCTICPCTVEELADFKFHLQFHQGEHKLKYYKCAASCGYKSNGEETMEAHHMAKHGGGKGDSSSDDEDATYMVAKLKVAFHNGKFMCPADGCSEAYVNVVELQEHSVQKHGGVLGDDHRHDFYKARLGGEGGNTRGVPVSGGEDENSNAGETYSSGVNSANNKRNEASMDINQSGSGQGSNYGKKIDDVIGEEGIGMGEEVKLENVDEEIGDETNVPDKQIEEEEEDDTFERNMEREIGIERTEEKINVDDDDDGQIRGEHIIYEDDGEEDNAESLLRNRLMGRGEKTVFEDADDSSITKYHCDLCDFGSNDYDVLKEHVRLTHGDEIREDMMNEDLQMADSMNDQDMVDDVADSTTKLDDMVVTHQQSPIVVEPIEDIAVMGDKEYDSRPPSRDDTVIVSQSPIPEFLTPSNPALMKCSVCHYATNYRKSYKRHMETHEKFKTFTGNAFKCAYCLYISQAKSPTMKHIKGFHPDKPSKMYYIRLLEGKTVSEMEMMFEFGAPASSSKGSSGHGGARRGSGGFRERKFSSGSSSGISSITAGDYQEPAEEQGLYDFEATLPQKIVFENPVKCIRCAFESGLREELIQHLRTHLFSPGRSSLEREPLGLEEDAESGIGGSDKDFKIKTENSEIPTHQDPDWFMELTKEEAAFCNKVTGLMLYQCKLCMFMDQSSTQVRVHYVDTHPEQLPILCGHCRERLDEDSFRQHHKDCHPLHPIKMVMLVVCSQQGKKHLSLGSGELEVEEVMTDQGGLNDWTDAMRPFVTARASGTYACNFCGYSQYGTSALKRHVFPIHFKCYPYQCAYCHIGMTQVNQMKSHIQKMHPSLPIRIRKPLPPSPTEEEIQMVTKTATPRKERDMSGRSPARSCRANSPASSSRSSPRSDSLMSPAQIKQELEDNQLDSTPSPSKLSVPKDSTTPTGTKSTAVRSYKKMFKCHYCNHTSKWTARDVQRHILTTHLGLKLFNCCYCDFGCYSRNRLETHVFGEHPGKTFKVANLDKRMNSVQVVKETEDGIDILALHKPNGETVWSLDPTKRDSLRRFTLSGKYVATTQRAPPGSGRRGEAESPSMVPRESVVRLDQTQEALAYATFADDDDQNAVGSDNNSTSGELTIDEGTDDNSPQPTNRYMLKKLLMQKGAVEHNGDLTPLQMGKMMRQTIPKNLKSTNNTWKCTLCGLTLMRCDRIKYHVICHHWKMRPYRCAYCDVMKYQREPIIQHCQESHPTQTLTAISVCEEKADALNQLMEKLENDSPEMAEKSLTQSTSHQHGYHISGSSPSSLGVLKKPGMSRSMAGKREEESMDMMDLGENSSSGSIDDDYSDKSTSAAASGPDVFKCVRCNHFSGDLASTRDHIIKVHFKHRLYTCDFCDASRNDIESMIQHIQSIHPDKPQRFSHAYGKFKADIDQAVRKVGVVGDNKVKPISVNVGQSGVNSSKHTASSNSNKSAMASPANPAAIVAICPACGETCKNQADLDWHLADDHPQYVKYQCGYCQVVSENKRELKNHMVDEHSDKPPDYNFIRNLPPSLKLALERSQEQLRIAANTVTKTIKPCKICDFHADSVAVLNNHLESVHLSQVLFKCKLCGGLHKTKDDLLVHYGILHRNDSLQYKVVPLGAEDEDDESETSENVLLSPRVNENSLLSPKTSEQKTQQAGDRNKPSPQQHHGHKPTARKSTTQAAFKPSSETNKNLSSSCIMDAASPSVDTNVNSHGNRRIVIRYECKHCNYTTKECVTIRRHVMTHINYKPYSCPLCNLSSIRSNCIKTHIKVHHKDFLSKAIYNKDLKMESMVHTSIIKVFGNRSGTLPEVTSEEMELEEGGTRADSPASSGGAASAAGDFKAPALGSAGLKSPTGSSGGERRSGGDGGSSVHSGEQNTEEQDTPGVKYSCKLCGYSYHGSSQNIRRHVMVHFNYRKFQCPYCEFTAIQSNNVTQHVQGIHDTEPVKYLTLKYKCAYCEFRTVQSHGVTKHIRGLHKGKPVNIHQLRDEDLEKQLDDAIIKVGPDSTHMEITRRKKLEKVKIERGKLKLFGQKPSFVIHGRRSQLGVNKPRKLSADQIIPPKPGQCLYYKCKICNFTENSSSRKCTNIRRHVMSHLSYKRYVCPYCPFCSTTTCMTKAHTSRKHPGKRVYWLDKKDPVLEKLMRANIVKVGGKPWTTYNYEDVNGTAYKSKMGDAMKGKSFPNTSLGTLKSPQAPIKKMDIPSLDARMQCASEVAIEDRGFGHYQCKMCKKRLANSSAIKRHVSAHFHYRRYGCPYCDLLFTQSTFSVNHVRAKHKGSAIYYMDNKDAKMEAKIRRAWVNLSVEEDTADLFTLDGIVRGAGKRKIKKPQRAFQDAEVVNAICNNYGGFVSDNIGEQTRSKTVAKPGAASVKVEPEQNYEEMEHEDDGATEEENDSDEMENDNGGAVEGMERDNTTNNSPMNAGMKSGGTARKSVSGELKAYRCVQCSYETEHKTSMMRHIMWKIGYKPFQCAYCSFQDVLSIGLRKHCLRKHKESAIEPIINKDPVKEAEAEDLLTRSTVHAGEKSAPRRVEPKAAAVEDDEASGLTTSLTTKPFTNFVFNAKKEPESHGYGDEGTPQGADLLPEQPLFPHPTMMYNYASPVSGSPQISPTIPTATPTPPSRGIGHGNKTSDEPIPDELIRRSVNKSKCEICGKQSSSKGYIYNHVIRHGPAKLKCVYCQGLFYFPKEAKIHNIKKHPELPLKVKRLWGTSNWDKKTAGIEPADENSSPFPASKVPKLELNDSAASSVDGDQASMDGSYLEGNQLNGSVTGEDGGSERSVDGASEPGEAAEPMQVAPEPETKVSSIKETFNIKPRAVSAGSLTNGGVLNATEQPSEDQEFEDSVMERTPIKIPRKHPATGVYKCAFCSYTTKTPNHIKCHVLVHEPAHWRCDHCSKKFMMLYKLRKHSTLVHKGELLMYTNLVTGENGVGGHINYAAAVLTSFPSSLATVPLTNEHRSNLTQQKAAAPANENQQINGYSSHNNHNNMEETSDYENNDVDNISLSSADMGEEEISLYCPKCRFRTVSEQELLAHFIQHSRESSVTSEGGIQFSCVLCAFVTESVADFNDHHDSHILNKPYHCGKCEYKDYLRASVVRHFKIEHRSERKIKVRYEPSPSSSEDGLASGEGGEKGESLLAKLSVYQHLHPEVELRDFLQLPIDLLHAFMVQNGLSEIHQ